MSLAIATQRIVDANTGATMAVEVLARRVMGNPPVYRSPASFGEACGEWGWWTLDLSVLDALSRAMRRRPWTVPVHVNVSPETMARPSAWEVWLHGLEPLISHHAPGVVVEVSERWSGSDYDLAGRLDELRVAGAKVALDDLGADHATLERLRQHSWDVCKIDWRPHVRSHVEGHLIDVLDECAGRDITSVLEGVELPRDIQRAKYLAVDHLQGFGLHRPTLHAPLMTHREV